MNKIKIFSAESSMGLMSMGRIDYVAFENEVNAFISQDSIEVLDIQYKSETTGSIIVATIMVYYKEK